MTLTAQVAHHASPTTHPTHPPPRMFPSKLSRSSTLPPVVSLLVSPLLSSPPPSSDFSSLVWSPALPCPPTPSLLCSNLCIRASSCTDGRACVCVATQRCLRLAPWVGAAHVGRWTEAWRMRWTRARIAPVHSRRFSSGITVRLYSRNNALHWRTLIRTRARSLAFSLPLSGSLFLAGSQYRDTPKTS